MAGQVGKILSVIKREYKTRVRTRGFIIGTILLPVFVTLLMAVPVVLTLVRTERPQTLVVVDLTGRVYPHLVKALGTRMKEGKSLYQLSLRRISPQQLPQVKKELSEAVDSKEIDGYILIPEGVLEKNEAEFYARNVSDLRRNRDIQMAITSVINRIRLEQMGLDARLLQELVSEVNLRTFRVGPGGKEQEDVGFTFALTYLLAMALYIGLVIYGNLVMRGVIEEKSSRVVELVISSVRPFQLMVGKILGIGAVGLTQFFIWAVALFLISLYGGSLLSSFGPVGSLKIPSVPIGVLIYFVLFFLLGYVLYSTLFAGVGAMVNSEQEAQHLVWPLILPLVIPVMVMFHVISNPESSLSVILSFVPLFSPLIMFMRISVQMPPFYEIIGSILILILSIWFLMWITAKIYRVGILMYGKPPNLPEILRWIRYG